MRGLGVPQAVLRQLHPAYCQSPGRAHVAAGDGAGGDAGSGEDVRGQRARPSESHVEAKAGRIPGTRGPRRGVDGPECGVDQVLDPCTATAPLCHPLLQALMLQQARIDHWRSSLVLPDDEAQGVEGQADLALLQPVCLPAERRHHVRAAAGEDDGGAVSQQAGVALQIQVAAERARGVVVDAPSAAGRPPACSRVCRKLLGVPCDVAGASVADLANSNEVPDLVVVVLEVAVEELHLDAHTAAVAHVHVQCLRRRGLVAGVQVVGRLGQELPEARLIRLHEVVQEKRALKSPRGACMQEQVRQLRCPR
mmetsp:Transcript_119368/g.333025  ORF Transcript_119368/g.333025 Transcript_119368/m.333025 type:complete len:309 (-) Transcript_119368:660-1586(-)